MTESIKLDACLLMQNYGPDARKALLNKADEAYNEGKEEHSIFYQVRLLFNMLQDRYFHMPTIGKKIESMYSTGFTDLKLDESKTTIDNKLIKYAIEKLKEQKQQPIVGKEENHNAYEIFYDFFQKISDPVIGFKKIVDTCKQFPDEWTILQVCKAARPQTTYSAFHSIIERDSDIYLTVLRHARSSEFPEPICLRFSAASQVELFRMYAKMAADCKEYMLVNPNDFKSRDAKIKYWENLRNLDYNIRKAIVELKQYIFPWLFIFKGIPRRKIFKDYFAEVDKLCKTYQLEARKQRVLLSLACVHAADLHDEEIEAFCEELTSNKRTRTAVAKLLHQVRDTASSTTGTTITHSSSNYPCILIVDEQLDHFFWEELNVKQEMCRVNSLHCLWKLFTAYKAKIKNGYLCVDIAKGNGACVINPTGNLPLTEMRLRAFFEYWTPSWLLKCNEKPTQEELLQNFFKRSCYIYAGHGSGLQFISGKHISKMQIDAVVFLFGCDSTRMHSNGLYSDMIGPHFYYHAALCPCLVGSILPALDSQMDSVAVELLSRWIAPDTKDVTWQNIDMKLWTKQGIIQKVVQTTVNNDKKEAATSSGSLCNALTHIHERGPDKYYYNTVPYVCRGLPVWNLNVQPMPK